MKGHLRNPGGPAGSVGMVTDGGDGRGKTGASRRAEGRTSDRSIVPMKPSNKAVTNAAERAEGRDRPGGIPCESGQVRTQSRVVLPSHLARVNEASRRDRRIRFHSSPRGSRCPTWVTFGKSRVRESRSLGSVRAKAEWLSYSTSILQVFGGTR